MHRLTIPSAIIPFILVGMVGCGGSGTKSTSVPSTNNVTLVPYLVRFGAKGLALRTSTGVFFLDHAPGL